MSKFIYFVAIGNNTYNGRSSLSEYHWYCI